MVNEIILYCDARSRKHQTSSCSLGMTLNTKALLSKRRLTLTHRHGVTSQKIWILNDTVERSWNVVVYRLTLGTGLGYGPGCPGFESEQRHEIFPFSKRPGQAAGPSRCIELVPTSQKALRLKISAAERNNRLCLRVIRRLHTEWAKHRGLYSCGKWCI